MQIKFDHIDNKTLKRLDTHAKLGYFAVFMPNAIYEGLQAMCKKHHIELPANLEAAIMQVIAEQLTA